MAVMKLAGPLSDYLAEAAARPFAWGGWDCGLGLVAGWVEACRGVDLAKPYRGAYRTRLGAARLLSREGGLVALFDRAADPAGFGRIETPEVGDVGVILADTPHARALVGAIRTRLGWAALAESGLTIAEATHVAAWRI